MLIDVFNKREFNLYMYEANMYYNKAIQLDNDNKFNESKEYFKKAGELYLKSAEIVTNSSLKQQAIEKYKESERMYYKVVCKIVKANKIVKGNKE